MNDVIGLASRGQHAKIVFDMDDPMGASTCVAAANACRPVPTGALMPAREVALSVPDKSVKSLCPYCGVGCQLTYHVKNDRFSTSKDATVPPITRAFASKAAMDSIIRAIRSASRCR